MPPCVSKMSLRKQSLMLCLLVLGLAGGWLSIRWKHFEVLTKSACVDEWSDEDGAWLWRQPLRIDLNEGDCDPLTVGAALDHYASVRTVTLRRNTGEWLDALFSQWRNRGSLKELYAMYSNLDDGHMKGFAGCADLKTAIFNNNQISGEVFHHCNHLDYLEFNGTPVTDRGLANIVVQCAEMERVCLHASKVTAAGVRDSGILMSPVLKVLTVLGQEGTKEELNQLRELSSLNPKVRLDTD